jgi:hypothetical protein
MTLAARSRHLATLLALLALLLASFPDALHRDGLHAPRGVAVESVASDCAQQHPPRFETRRTVQHRECPGCLLQLQQRVAPAAEAVAAAPVLAAPHATVDPVTGADHDLYRPSSPRAPPARLG